MERVCQALHWKTLLLYIDYKIVMGPEFDTYLTRLAEVLQHLDKVGLKLKPSCNKK